MRLILSALSLVLATFCAANAQDISGQNSASRSDETNTSLSNEDAKSKRETSGTSSEQGRTNTRSRQTGIRQSTRKELAKALEQMSNNSLQRSLNVVGIFAQAAQYRGLVDNFELEDFLLSPIGSSKKYRDNLQTWATTNTIISEHLIDIQRLKRHMVNLYVVGHWISNSLKNARLADSLGVQDWKLAADYAAQYDKTGLQMASTVASDAEAMISGVCRFNGQATRIKCGQCLIDLSNKNALNELVCGGLGEYGPDSAGGERVVVQASESYSVRDTATLSKSDEAFRALTHTLDRYLKWAASQGKTVEASAVSKLVLGTATKQSRNSVFTIQSVEDQDDPMKILGNLGIR